MFRLGRKAGFPQEMELEHQVAALELQSAVPRCGQRGGAPGAPALWLGGHTLGHTLPPGWEGTHLGTRCQRAGRAHARTRRAPFSAAPDGTQRSGPGEAREGTLLPLGCRSQSQICHCDPLPNRRLQSVFSCFSITVVLI